jgi:MFS family permease
MAEALAGDGGPRRDRATWALYLLTGYFASLETVLGPVAPFLRAEQNIGFAVASLHFGAFALGGVAAGTVAERLARRFGRRAVTWGGGAGMAAGALLLVSVPHTAVTVAAAFVMGSPGALLLICVQAELADRHRAHGAVVLLESNVAASACAIVTAAAVGALAGAGASWRGAPLLAVAAFGALFVCFRGVRLGAPGPRPKPGEARDRLPRPFWAIAGVLVLGVGTEWCLAYWGADFLVDSGVGVATAAATLSVFFAAMLCGRLFGSRVARRVAELRLLMIALAVALAGFLVFWLGDGLTWRTIGLFGAGLGLANVYPVAISSGARFGRPHTARATARMASSAGIAVFLAPIVLGGLADGFGIAPAFSIVVPMLLVSMALTVAAARLG